jgi:hypothetical protein
VFDKHPILEGFGEAPAGLPASLGKPPKYLGKLEDLIEKLRHPANISLVW